MVNLHKCNEAYVWLSFLRPLNINVYCRGYVQLLANKKLTEKLVGLIATVYRDIRLALANT